jgi:hypothetical protein
MVHSESKRKAIRTGEEAGAVRCDENSDCPIHNFISFITDHTRPLHENGTDDSRLRVNETSGQLNRVKLSGAQIVVQQRRSVPKSWGKGGAKKRKRGSSGLRSTLTHLWGGSVVDTALRGRGARRLVGEPGLWGGGPGDALDGIDRSDLCRKRKGCKHSTIRHTFKVSAQSPIKYPQRQL